MGEYEHSPHAGGAPEGVIAMPNTIWEAISALADLAQIACLALDIWALWKRWRERKRE